MQLAVGNVNKARNRPTQVEQGVQLDGRLGGAKRRPRKHRQAQVDGGGIEGVDCVRQIHAKRVGCIEFSRLGNQSLGKVGVDAPVAPFVGIGQRGAAHRLAQSHMVELRRLRRKTNFDVAQTLPVSELGKGHATKLLGATQSSRAVIATVARNDSMKGFPWQEVHDLRKQRLASVHHPLRALRNRKGYTLSARRSNRGHSDSHVTTRNYWRFLGSQHF